MLSEHPLSGKQDSAVDERLIGWWEELPEADDAKTAGERMVVGRLGGEPRLLEVAWLRLDDEQRIEVSRLRMRPVSLEGRWHLSVSGNDEADFLLFRYALEDDVVSLQFLDEKKVAGAIERDEIAGTVERDADGGLDDVRLTAPTSALRAWILEADAWDDDVQRFRRVPIPVPELEK